MDRVEVMFRTVPYQLRLNNEEEPPQVVILLYCMSQDAEGALVFIKVTTDDRKKYMHNKPMDKLEEYSRSGRI